MDQLSSDIKTLIDTKQRRHPSTNWKKRQRRQPRNKGSKLPGQSRPPQPQSQDPTFQQTQDQESPGQSQPQSQDPHPPATRRRRHQRFHPQEARKYQRWYRANKKKCVRNILGEDHSPRCEIPVSTLENYFTQAPPTEPSSVSPPPWLPQSPNTSVPDDLSSPISVEKVKAQLKRLPAQSSPGPEGIPYYIWRYTGSCPLVLSTICTICFANQRIPASWKKSNTILIFKRGDANLPNNWRPISLQPAIYKIYVAILARRLASWAIHEGKIFNSQKGFLPFEGCFEHSFIMQSVLQE